MKKILHVVLLMMLSVAVFSQGELPVNLFTGTPSVSVPIWNVVSHDISEPVSLVYSANGVKLEQADGYYGLGWDLAIAGSITRDVRGLPDDVQETSGRKGWLYMYGDGDVVANTMGIFANGTPLVPGACTTAENTDNAALASFNYLLDTEPDVFYYNFGGQSGSFVFDNSITPVIRFMPLNDLLVVPTRHPTTQQITSFTVTTNDGIKYFFNEVVSCTALATQQNPSTTSGNPIPAFNREYEQYKNSISYTTEWKLTRIESPSAAYITFTYASESFNPTREVSAAFSNATTTTVKTLYKIAYTSFKKHVIRVQSSAGARLELKNKDGLLTEIEIHDDRNTATLVKEFAMLYKEYTALNNDGSSMPYTRQFLSSVQESSGCEVLPPTVFQYVGTTPDYKIYLPAPNSKSKDFWGYYNARNNTDGIPAIYIYPSEPAAERYRLTPIPGYVGTEVIMTGADRTPNENAMRTGVLNRIVYPTGGITEIQYEANRYYDTRTSQTLLGGGLRVASIKYFDGMNVSPQITKTFTYTNAGQSTGKLINRPSFAIPAFEYRDPSTFHITTGNVSYGSLTGNVQSLWKHLTIRTEEDLTEEQSYPVGYTMVSVARPGAGSAKYEYAVGGVYGETTSGQWAATENKYARPTASCPVMGVVTGGSIWAFPFARNPNFSHERGAVTRKTEYDETGTTVRVIDYTYQYLYKTGSTPTTVYGIKYDRFANSDNAVFFFGKYGLLTDVAKPVLVETVTYNAPGPKTLISSTEYSYASTAHKLLTKVKRTEADGTIYYAKLKYPLDYGTIADPADVPSQMIRTLQTSFRNGSAIESVNTIVRPGDTEKVTGGSILTFAPFSVARPLLKTSLTLSTDAVIPIASFTDSKVQLSSGTNTFMYDAKYEVVSKVIGYEGYDRPYQSIGADSIPTGASWGYNSTVPIVSFTNMNRGEFAFSDFETTISNTFTLTNAFYGSGRTGVNAVHPYATLTKTLTKGSNTYVFALWLKKASAGVGLRVRVRNTALTTTYYDQTLTFTPGGTDFEYFKTIIPASTFPSTFVVDVSSLLASPGSSSPSLTPVMDDLAFYPEAGDLSSMTYTLPFGPDAVTDARGMTAYTAYDKLGRVLHVKDKDKNIIRRNKVTYGSTPQQLSSQFTFPANVYAGFPATFTGADNSCVTTGITYEWSMDGGAFTTGTQIKSYTFATTGRKRVELKLSHATYGTSSTVKYVNVINKPIDLNICAKGVTEYNCQTGTVLYTAVCSAITATPPTLGTIFRVSTTEDITLTYQWKKRDVGTTTWSNVATTQTYTFPGIVLSTNTFEVMCVVTETATGRTSDSPLMQVIVYPCNP